MNTFKNKYILYACVYNFSGAESSDIELDDVDLETSIYCMHVFSGADSFDIELDDVDLDQLDQEQVCTCTLTCIN